MRRGMDKALAAFACAVLIGALGALSWNTDQEPGLKAWGGAEVHEGAEAPDKVIHEIEKLHSIWGNHDTGSSGGESAAGNS